MPSSIQKDLEQLFVDRIVYGMHWRKFMMTQERSWRESAYLVSLLHSNGGDCISNMLSQSAGLITSVSMLDM